MLKFESYNNFILNPKTEISSLLINKLKNSHDDFRKYSIDVSVDEVENNDSEVKLKYKFSLLSDPTNSKISIEGLVSLCGEAAEISKQLEPDQNNVPLVVNTVYQEIFPLIFIVSKSMQIPCPAHRLSNILSAQSSEVIGEQLPTKIQQPTNETNADNVEEVIEDKTEVKPDSIMAEEITQEAKVSSI